MILKRFAGREATGSKSGSGVCVARLGTRKNPRVYVPNVSVCRFKTPPCVPACASFASSHGDVLNVRTERFGTYTRGASLSLLLSFLLSLFRRSLLGLSSLLSSLLSHWSLVQSALSVYTRL